jgi:hypothetical protein
MMPPRAARQGCPGLRRKLRARTAQIGRAVATLQRAVRLLHFARTFMGPIVCVVRQQRGNASAASADGADLLRNPARRTKWPVEGASWHRYAAVQPNLQRICHRPVCQKHVGNYM